MSESHTTEIYRTSRSAAPAAWRMLAISHFLLPALAVLLWYVPGIDHDPVFVFSGWACLGGVYVFLLVVSVRVLVMGQDFVWRIEKGRFIMKSPAPVFGGSFDLPLSALREVVVPRGRGAPVLGIITADGRERIFSVRGCGDMDNLVGMLQQRAEQNREGGDGKARRSTSRREWRPHPLRSALFSPRWSWHRRCVLYGTLACLVTGDLWYRRWQAQHLQSSRHYIVHSSATQEETTRVLEVAEMLLDAYREFFRGSLPATEPQEKLKLRLYGSRDEFRRCNRGIGWAEAFYRAPWCHQYVDSRTPNPYHWMIHEATHQLNHEIARWHLAQWLDEGTALYFSTSRIGDEQLLLGVVDPETYPVWWLSSLKLSGDWPSDVAAHRVIPLECILEKRPGPDMDVHFNTYYIHWWSLVRFLLHHENGTHRKGYEALLAEGGSWNAFEREVGSIAEIEKEWYLSLQNEVKRHGR